jgi:predicted amidophosphoribosyltransferase
MNAFKFGGQGARGWGLIFARALIGFLDDNWPRFGHYELIVASPSYREVGAAQRFDSSRFIVRMAATIDKAGRPFDSGSVPAIIKTAETTPMKGKKWRQREEIAETELREVLAIPDASRTRGKHVIVFDDLYTSGHTLNEAARCLIAQGGAVQVTGISLARQLHRD